MQCIKHSQLCPSFRSKTEPETSATCAVGVGEESSARAPWERFISCLRRMLSSEASHMVVVAADLTFPKLIKAEKYAIH